MSIKNDFFTEVNGLAEELQIAQEKYDTAVNALSQNTKGDATPEELAELEQTYAEEVAQCKVARHQALGRHFRNLEESIDMCLSRAPTEEEIRLLQALSMLRTFPKRVRDAAFKKLAACPLAVEAFFEVLGAHGYNNMAMQKPILFSGCTVGVIEKIVETIDKNLRLLEETPERMLSSLNLDDPDVCFQQLAGIDADMSEKFFALIEA